MDNFTNEELQNTASNAEDEQLAEDAVRYFGIIQSVRRVHEEMMPEFKTPVPVVNMRIRYLRFAVAAAVLALVIFGTRYYLSPWPDAQEIFAANYQTYQPGTMRSGNNVSLSSIENAYLSKNFEQVVALSDTNFNTLRDRLLTGMALAELHRDAEAILIYNRILAENKRTGTASFKDETEYYLALVYINANQPGAALKLLEQIKADPQHTYNSKVTTKLLRQVGRLQEKK